MAALSSSASDSSDCSMESVVHSTRPRCTASTSRSLPRSPRALKLAVAAGGCVAIVKPKNNSRASKNTTRAKQRQMINCVINCFVQPAGDRARSLCRHKCHLSWRAVGTDVSITCNQFRRNHHAERDGSSEKTVTAQGEETVRNTIAKNRIPNSALMVTIAAMAERDELSQQWPHA